MIEEYQTNSTTKGNDLEIRIFRLLQHEISQDRFLFKEKSCKIFQKKGYYSRDRDGEIVFDVSIEAFLPGQDSYSVLILVECKNYGHPVPVDDAEEFYAKIQQISGANVKGIIASTNSFQDGTRKFAKSKGIGLLRYYDNLDFKWVLTRSPSFLVTNSYAINEFMNAFRGIDEEAHRSKYFDFYCYVDDNYTNSLKLFFSNLINLGTKEDDAELLRTIENPIVDSRAAVPYMDEADIEEFGDRVLATIHYTGGDVRVEDVCKWQLSERGLQVIVQDPQEPSFINSGILGRITFQSPPQISVFRSAHKNAEQQKFTLAHELGHLLLDHDKYMSAEYCQGADFELESPAQLGVQDIMRMEWQANCFASCLLLPRRPFINDFLRLIQQLGIKDRGFGLLYLDEQECNKEAYYHLTDILKSKYKVSRSVVRIRLKKLGLLNDARDRKNRRREGVD
jgi:Zn-dependent peptidase ImmA (M78 family)